MRAPLVLLASGVVPLLLLQQALGRDQIAGGTFSIYMENDLFAGADRQYTSGVKFGWSSADLASYSDWPYSSPFLPLFNLPPYINEKDLGMVGSWAYGQEAQRLVHDLRGLGHPNVWDDHRAEEFRGRKERQVIGTVSVNVTL